MKRRTLLALPAAPVVVAQPAPRRIGLLFGDAAPPGTEPAGGGFVAALREAGLAEGPQLRIERRYGGGSPNGVVRAAAELVALPVDVIVTFATPGSHAARDASTRIPIVMAGTADPVATGLVASLARPGGNITGVSVQAPEVARKSLEVLRDWRPDARRIGLLLLPSDPFAPTLQAMLDSSATALRLEARVARLAEAAAISDTFAQWARQRVDAAFVQASVPFAPAVAAALKHRLPSFSFIRRYADLGGLFTYGPDITMVYRQAAVLVRRILLDGAKPSELPVQQPTYFELVINSRTARSLGLDLPASLRLRATEVIV